jgi:hypothetical protein
MTTVLSTPVPLRSLGDFCLISIGSHYAVVMPSGKVRQYPDLASAQRGLLAEFGRDVDAHNRRLLRALGDTH